MASFTLVAVNRLADRLGQAIRVLLMKDLVVDILKSLSVYHTSCSKPAKDLKQLCNTVKLH